MKKKLSFHVANNVLDSLLAICLHSSQKMALIASNCHFLRILWSQWVKDTKSISEVACKGPETAN